MEQGQLARTTGKDNWQGQLARTTAARRDFYEIKEEINFSMKESAFE